MTLHSEAFHRYQETHEGHFDYTGREEWAHKFFELNFLPLLTPKHHTVLEIACGAGDMLRVFREKGYTAVGTDLCPDNVRRTEGVFLHDVLVKPIRSHRFDIIVMMGVIEHLKKDALLVALRNVRSMLAPNGLVFITTQNMDSPMGDHFRYLDITHELGFTRESLAQVGRLADFKRVEVYKTQNPGEQPRGWKGVVKRLYRLVYELHLRLLGGCYRGTWWDADGLLGVFHA
jgi:2-polyprenyl-3-methyl-5-hydroxy-6-metoxy-1,4-benzoquinol methylase